MEDDPRYGEGIRITTYGQSQRNNLHLRHNEHDNSSTYHSLQNNSANSNSQRQMTSRFQQQLIETNRNRRNHQHREREQLDDNLRECDPQRQEQVPRQSLNSSSDLSSLGNSHSTLTNDFIVGEIIEASNTDFNSVSAAEKNNYGVMKIVQECVKCKIWPDYKFLTDQGMRKMTENVQKGNILDRLLVATGKESSSMQSKIRFWKEYGKVVQQKLNAFKNQTSKTIKEILIQGNVFIEGVCCAVV